MDGASILLVVAALGVSFGWQPDAADPRAYEVTAQIEPELLDVLKSGKAVPLEAHVPAEVQPIRKVRIVVGTGPLPRKTLSTTAAAKPTERIVRGQEPTSQPHTAQYQSDPWGDDRYGTDSPSTVAPPPTRQYDQRGATIGVDNIRTAQAPSPWDRAQTAVSETSNGLRDGVEAGIRQANDQFTSAGQQLSNSAGQLGQSANQQFQNLTGTGGQSQPTTWPAPPPSSSASSNQLITPLTAPSLSSPTTRTATSAPITPLPSTPWSSMNPNLAPPRFMNPTMSAPTTAPPASTNRLAQTPSGPTFPASSGNIAAPPLHSVLADPAASNRSGSALPPPPATSQNWASGWGSANTSAATIGAAQPTSSPPAAAPVVDNRYTPQPAAGSGAKDLWAGFPAPQPQAMPPSALPASSPQPAAQFANQPVPSFPPATQPQNPAAAGQPTITTAAQHSSLPGTPTGEQLPWIPLLVVSVSLAGSLAANLFLGWSYADARFRYRNLVRKTTSSFHRATGAAA